MLCLRLLPTKLYNTWYCIENKPFNCCIKWSESDSYCIFQQWAHTSFCTLLKPFYACMSVVMHVGWMHTWGGCWWMAILGRGDGTIITLSGWVDLSIAEESKNTAGTCYQYSVLNDTWILFTRQKREKKDNWNWLKLKLIYVTHGDSQYEYWGKKPQFSVAFLFSWPQSPQTQSGWFMLAANITNLCFLVKYVSGSQRW